MEFKRGGFLLNGKESSEFNVVIRERPTRPSAVRAVELRERSGNDSIVVDFAYYKNVTQVISCYAKARSLEEVPFLEKEIAHWLDTGAYSDYVTYYDPHYIYQAIVIGPPEFTGQRKNGLQIPFEFTISLRPFKSGRVGKLWKEQPKLLTNTERYPSKPKIYIAGTGDCFFQINDQEYKLKGLEGDITIDSLVEESYRVKNDQVILEDKKTLFRDYPILTTGENKIMWSNNIVDFKIMPRWWTKI